jgi:hypothetical protein
VGCNYNATDIVIGEIEERIDLSDCDPARPVRDLDNFVSRSNFSLLDYTQIEPRFSV